MQKITHYGMFFLLLCASCTTIVEKPNKEDSTPLQALSGKIFSPPFILTDTFKREKGKTYYAIRISKAGFYTISLSGVKGVNFKLSLLDNNTQTIAIANDNVQNGGEKIPALFLKNKLYYVLVEPLDYLLPTNDFNSDYSILVEPFSNSRLFSPLQLDLGQLPNLHKIQVLETKLPLYGFFSPINNDSIENSPLGDLAARIVKDNNIPHYSFHLALYTFKSPSLVSKVKIHLTGVPYFSPLLLLAPLEDFQNFLHKGPLSQKWTDSFFLLDEHQIANKDKLLEHTIEPKRVYILGIIGLRLTERPVWQKIQKPYKLSLKFTS